VTHALEQVTVAAEPDAWRRAGFEVDGEVCTVGQVEVHLAGAGAGRGLLSWSLTGLEGAELGGLPEPVASGIDGAAAAAPHPNTVSAVDHVVAFSPDLDRTVAALEDAGLDLRRIREGPTPGGAMRQAFFRIGEPILEVIEARADSPLDAPRLWGLAFVTSDLDAPARFMGDDLGEPRDAVQPGRRIVSARRSAELGAPVAFMTPHYS
jgi:hypothetical protein